MSDVDLILTALADPTRRRVVYRLREKPRRAGELADSFGVTPAAMSRHLRVLHSRGLIEEERFAADARVRLFRLRREPFAKLHDWLDRVEAFWSVQLDSFKKHAERTRSRKHG